MVTTSRMVSKCSMTEKVKRTNNIDNIVVARAVLTTKDGHVGMHMLECRVCSRNSQDSTGLQNVLL